MKAMILAAGRGKRMMPLTAHTPKPLLKVAGKPLLQYHIERLKKAGFDQIVINHCHLGQQIEEYFGDGRRFGVSIQWSPESKALETAGGMRQALDLLDNQPYLAINGDIWTDFPFETLRNSPNIDALGKNQVGKNQALAHLILVPNPAQNPDGDFGLVQGKVCNQAKTQWTYSGIAVYNPKLVSNCPLGKPMGAAPLIRSAAEKSLISGEIYQGSWQDIGTPERLAQLEQQLIHQ